MATSFAELDLAARTDKLEKAVEEIRKLGDQGERTEQRVKKSTNAMAVGFGRLAGLLGGVAAGFAGLFGAATLARGAQDVQAITNGFLGMGQSADQAAASLARVAAIAERTRAPLTATAELYRRVSVAAGELGATSQQVGQFTQNIGMALAASGTSAAQASGALLQLSQAMAGGVVRAEEFNSILEGAFPIAQAAARGLDAAGGSVGRLRQLVVEGKVSSEAFFNAILSQSDAIEEAFGRTVPTVSQAMTDLNNSVSLAAAQLDSALGLSASLAQGLLALSDGVMWASQNTDVLRVGFEALSIAVIALAATQLPALTLALYAKVTAMAAAATGAGLLTGAMRALGAAVALAGGPWGILAGLIAAAAGYFLLFRDNANEAETAMDQSKRASDELNAALGVFYQTAAPSAASEAIRLANSNYELANSAYEAAKGELAKQRAMQEANRAKFGAARGEDGNFMDPYGALVGGSVESEDMRRINAALGNLAQAESRLNTVMNERRIATTAVTGAMSEQMTVADATTEVVNKLNEVLAGNGVGSAGGAGGADPFQQRLEALQQGLMTEREVVDAWYRDAQLLLADQRAMELLGEEEHKQALLRVEEEYQRQLGELRGANNNAALEGAASFFGSMAEVAQAGGDRMTKVARVFGAAQALINTYLAASQALADPTLPFFAKFAAVAKVVATGMGLVSAIRGGGGGGGGGGSAPATREATPDRAAQQRFLRIEVQGDGMFADMLRNNVQSIADALIDESRAGGTTIVVGR